MSGGGARGAYEVGVLSFLLDELPQRVGRSLAFDVVTGTSVGAIHAAYVAATAGLRGRLRSRALAETWKGMRLGDVVRMRPADLIGVPLRALGLTRLARTVGVGNESAQAVGGLIDLTPLERIVSDRIPWATLRDNLKHGRPGALCISCTEVRSGRVTVFMDGPMSDTTPWNFDPGAFAVAGAIGQHHVRASAAIPFLFPAVRLGDRFYVDGGLRMNTPLSPALRLGASRVLVIATKKNPGPDIDTEHPDDVITQPSFLLGKVLNALTLDQLEVELKRVELINAMIERGFEVYGRDYLERINVAVRAQRGVGFRKVRTCVIRPSQDIGKLAAECRREGGGDSAGVAHVLMAKLATRGTPADEADLLSYVFFDRRVTARLVEMGREDARAREDEVFELLSTLST
jgi:NTE family protein